MMYPIPTDGLSTPGVQRFIPENIIDSINVYAKTQVIEMYINRPSPRGGEYTVIKITKERDPNLFDWYISRLYG